ncbi:MAG TPA: hypothetical protein VFU22_20255 [Roseiflexaceae bacterium]|nr:hypothetical protein [Roseiflexaceae bacterium]
MTVALLVILSHTTAAILLGWGYFRRYAVSRPPIGVFNLWDIAVMMAGIILVPYLYLLLPIWLVAGLLVLGILSVLYFAWEPVLRARWAIWLLALGLMALDIGAVWMVGPGTPLFFAVNNLVLVLAIVGITNLWAQSGMKARDVTLLAGVLAIYDVIVTWQLTQTADLFGRLFGLPLAPIIAWPLGAGGKWLGIGMGDMLLATVFPLVMRKAFGCAAGIASLVGNLGLIVALLTAAVISRLQVLFPVMIVLGPLMIVQYAYWRRRRGQEQTTRQYLRI